MKFFKNFRLPTILTVLFFLATTWSCNKKDDFETDLSKTPAWAVSQQEFDAAIAVLKTSEEKNFFDFGFSEKNNPNILEKLSERNDQELLKALRNCFKTSFRLVLLLFFDSGK